MFREREKSEENHLYHSDHHPVLSPAIQIWIVARWLARGGTTARHPQVRDRWRAAHFQLGLHHVPGNCPASERRLALYGKKGVVPLAAWRLHALVRRRGCGPFQTAGACRADSRSYKGSRSFSIDHHPRRNAEKSEPMEDGLLSHR